MTSPFISRPEATNDRYNDVHSKGSTYGQDLKSEGQVRALLTPHVESPFQRAFRRFGEFTTSMISGIADAIRGNGGAKFGAISGAVDERLGPINDSILESGKHHKELADKVEVIITDQRGIIKKSDELQAKIEDADKKTDSAIDKADKLIQSQDKFSAEIQPQINKALSDSDKAIKEALELNKAKDKLQDQFDIEQVRINKLTQDQLWAHQDMIELVDIRSPRVYGWDLKNTQPKQSCPYVSGSNSAEHVSTPFFEVWKFDYVIFIAARGSWEGVLEIGVNWSNGAYDNWLNQVPENGYRVYRFEGGAPLLKMRHLTIRVVVNSLARTLIIALENAQPGGGGNVHKDTGRKYRWNKVSDPDKLGRDIGQRWLRFKNVVTCNKSVWVRDENDNPVKIPAGEKIYSQKLYPEDQLYPGDGYVFKEMTEEVGDWRITGGRPPAGSSYNNYIP